MNRFGRFLLGATASTVSCLFGYYFAKKKYERLANEEIENVKKKLEEHYKNKTNNEEKPTNVNEPIVVSNKSSIVPTHVTEDKYVNYAKQYMTESVEKKIEAEKEASKKELDKSFPYSITETEYENSDYIAKTLYYYTKESTLTDADGRHIERPEELIGVSAVNAIKANDTDVVYARNELLEADFEIVIIDGSIYGKDSKNRIIPEEYENN